MTGSPLTVEEAKEDAHSTHAMLIPATEVHCYSRPDSLYPSRPVLRPHLCWLLYGRRPATRIRLEFSSFQLCLCKWISLALPWPVDHLAPALLLVPFAPPGTVVLIAPTSYLVAVHHGLHLRFVSPPLRLRRAPPWSHRLRLSPPRPWLHLGSSSLQFQLGLQDLQCRHLLCYAWVSRSPGSITGGCTADSTLAPPSIGPAEGLHLGYSLGI